MPKKALAAYVSVVAAWLLYAVLTLTTPLSSSTARFGLTSGSVFLLRLTIILPYVLTWLAGTYAAVTLAATSRSMPDKEQAVAFRKIAQGIAVMLSVLIVTALVGTLRQRLGRDAIPTLTITTNYLYVFGPLVAYAIIFAGARHLPRARQQAGEQAAWAAASSLALAAFSAAYVWLIFTNPTRGMSATPELQATYYLPDAAIVLTVVIPFIASCVVGLLSVYMIGMYARTLTGFVFRAAARNLIGGFLWVLGGSIFLQALQSLGSTRLSGIGLGALLAIVYVFLFAQTGGYVLLSLGAKKLSAVENIMGKYQQAAAEPPKPSV